MGSDNGCLSLSVGSMVASTGLEFTLGLVTAEECAVLERCSSLVGVQTRPGQICGSCSQVMVELTVHVTGAKNRCWS